MIEYHIRVKWYELGYEGNKGDVIRFHTFFFPLFIQQRREKKLFNHFDIV